MLSKIIRPNVLVKDRIPIGRRPSGYEELEDEKSLFTKIGHPRTLEQRIQQEREQAHRAGFEDGKQMGLEEGKKVGEKVARDFFSLLEHIKIQKENILRDSEQAVLRLSLALSSKIVGNTVEIKPEIVLEVVKKAIQHLVDKNKVVLKVNPKDCQLVKSHHQQLLATIDGIKNLEIEEDIRVKPGGCLIETDSGNVDARLETQMQVLREALLDKPA